MESYFSFIAGLLTVVGLVSYRSQQVMAVPLESFYPFGSSNGDLLLGQILDESATLNLTQPFRFFDITYSVIYVNNNGDVSFVSPFDDYAPKPFPLEGGVPIIAPFWADFDARCEDSGNVSYRETTLNSTRAKFANDIQNTLSISSDFYPSSLIIVTWYQAHYHDCYDKLDDKTNTFQLVLATDGNRSFAVFLYLDDGIQWTTGDDSGGMNGLGGNEAQVGYDAGDGINHYTVPGSMTPSIVDIETTSNVGIPGMYILEVGSSYAVEPQFVNDAGSQIEGNENDMVILNCSAYGFPAPNIVWQKNGQFMINVSNKFNVENTQYNASDSQTLPTGLEEILTSSLLTVSSLTTTDSGSYSCRADNNVGPGIGMKTPYTLTVTVEPRFVNDVGSQIEGNENDRAILNCSAYGFPVPNIVWKKNDQLVINVTNKFKIENKKYSTSESQTLPTGLEGTSSLLTVLSLIRTDSGNYSCRADNNVGLGIVMKTPHTLSVIAADPASCAFSPCVSGGVCSSHEAEFMCQCTGQNCPAVGPVEIPPTITKPPVNTFGQLYGEVELSCIATGNPQPTILWYKDRHRLTDAVADFPTLVFPRLDLGDRGFYYCEAFNFQNGERVSQVSQAVILNIKDIVQYEATIILPEDFYQDRRKRQSQESTGQQKIEELVSSINQILSGSQLSSSNSSFFFVDLKNYDSINFTHPSLSLPVVFTLITEEEIGETLRLRIESELTQVGEKLNVKITFGEVERFDGCQANTTIIPSQSGNTNLNTPIQWPETSIGATAHVTCPCSTLTIGTSEGPLQASRLCGGDFTNGAAWQAAFVDPCDFTDLARNICNIANLDSAEAKVHALEAITEDASSFGSIEVAASVTVLITTTDDVGGNTSLTDDFLSVVDNLLDVSEVTLRESQGTANTSAKLLDAIHTVTAEIPIPVNHTDPVILPHNSFAVSVQEVDPEEFAMQVFSVSLGDNPFSEDNLELNENNLDFSSTTTSTASLTLPKNLFDSLGVSNSSRITQSVYLTDALYLRRNENLLEVGSIIIAASVVNNTIEGLDPPISLTFQKNPLIENVTDLVCTFWNPQLDDGFGDWSSEGCRRDGSYDNMDDSVTCYCNHLTSFSILLDLSPTPAPTSDEVEVFLSAVTYIGCILSILCLLLTIATHLSSKKLRLSEHGQLLLNLCFGLLGLYFFFILAIHSPAVMGFCMLVAVLLQYFFLVSFLAMAAEAINLYMKLVVVLGSKISQYASKAAIVCWVLPVFIVLFTFSPKPDAYANEYFCRPVGVPFYIGMMVPFILIYVFNWIIFTIIITTILHKNRCKFGSKQASQHQKGGVSAQQQFVIAVTLSVLFGIGWGIGLLATEEFGSSVARDFFASLFVIITSFHGLLIFILHCARSKDAKKEWRRWFFKATKKDFSDFTSSTFGYVQVHLKTSSLRPLSPSSASKTTEKCESSAIATFPLSSTTDEQEIVKSKTMKQHEESSASCTLPSVVETTYDRPMAPELDTELTKVDLATLEDPESGDTKLNEKYFQDREEETRADEVKQDEDLNPKETLPNICNEQIHVEDGPSATKTDSLMQPAVVDDDPNQI